MINVITQQYLKAKLDKVAKSIAIGQTLNPINLNKYKKNCLLVDSETIGQFTKGEKLFPYDISFKLIRNYQTVEEFSLINSTIFDNEYLMNNAFYKSKIPYYREKLRTDKRYKKLSDIECLKFINKIINEYNVSVFFAYNGNFDYKAINNLYSLYPNIKNNFKKLYLVDILKVATEIITTNKNIYQAYMNFCINNQLVTEKKLNVKTNAETIYRFINNDLEFTENHTGLEDTSCELDILKSLINFYQKYNYRDYYYKLNSVYCSYDFTISKNGKFRIEPYQQKLVFDF